MGVWTHLLKMILQGPARAGKRSGSQACHCICNGARSSWANPACPLVVVVCAAGDSDRAPVSARCSHSCGGHVGCTPCSGVLGGNLHILWAQRRGYLRRRWRKGMSARSLLPAHQSTHVADGLTPHPNEN